ncbi:STAS domain-containing protein [Woodsholea maritima]|uniref:STAS domain-containing protein n=1 Tax=Woodsholea maritima TaxID=240237 RepID=UPI00037B3373|nr:STAS domain-containing protein [Woodsholea maritima]
MDYACSPRDSHLHIALTGILTFDDHEKFKGVIRAINESDNNQVEVSLAELTMIDSAGVGMLILANDKAKKANKTMRLSGVKGHVEKVLQLSKIDQIIKVN